jgi:hypothetical protein
MGYVTIPKLNQCRLLADACHVSGLTMPKLSGKEGEAISKRPALLGESRETRDVL